MSKEKNIFFDLVIGTMIMLLLLVVTTDTLLWGTNINQLWAKIAQMCLAACTCFLLLHMIREKRINVKSMKFAMLILLSMLVFLTGIVNQDLRFGYLYKITLFAFGFSVTEYLTIEKFSFYYNRCMLIIAVASLIGFCLEFISPGAFEYLPKIFNSAGFEFDSALIYNRFATEGLCLGIRNYGIYREPGVFQLFLSLAVLFELVYTPKVNMWRMTIYVAAIASTYSTTGYIALAALFAFAFIKTDKFSNKKKLQILGILTGCIALFCLIFWSQVSVVFQKVFGKFEFSNHSFLTRLGSFGVNFILWLRNPVFGIGLTDIDALFTPISEQLYGIPIKDNTNMLLAQFASHGLLFGGIWIYAYMRASAWLGKNSVERLIILAYIFVQGISQNLSFSPMGNVLLWYCMFAKHESAPSNMQKAKKTVEKNIVTINLGNYGSTGGIAREISELAMKHGYTTYHCYPRRPENGAIGSNDIPMSSYLFLRINNRLDYHTGLNGCFAVFSTANLLRKISKIDIDILHLHNLHSSYINIPMLFSYIKRHKLRTVWTLHDCWSMTALCPHFTMAKCDQWINGCQKCPQLRHYSAGPGDSSRFMWYLKKKCVTRVEDLTIVTPSRWLQSLVEKSYLKEYPSKLIYNGINLDVFHPTPSDFRQKYGLQNKYIVVGVAFDWGKRKGLDVFVEMAKRLNNRFQIVLIGTNEQIDKLLPDNIISIRRTVNQQELAGIYTAADVFANPTREEVLGLVNIEALACGTPVLTFRSGGSPECIDDTCGSVVECDDIDAFEREVVRICTQKVYSAEACITHARLFDKNMKYQEYIRLYERND